MTHALPQTPPARRIFVMRAPQLFLGDPILCHAHHLLEAMRQKRAWRRPYVAYAAEQLEHVRARLRHSTASLLDAEGYHPLDAVKHSEVLLGLMSVGPVLTAKAFDHFDLRAGGGCVGLEENARYEMLDAFAQRTRGAPDGGSSGDAQGGAGAGSDAIDSGDTAGEGSSDSESAGASSCSSSSSSDSAISDEEEAAISESELGRAASGDADTADSSKGAGDAGADEGRSVGSHSNSSTVSDDAEDGAASEVEHVRADGNGAHARDGYKADAGDASDGEPADALDTAGQRKLRHASGRGQGLAADAGDEGLQRQPERARAGAPAQGAGAAARPQRRLLRRGAAQGRARAGRTDTPEAEAVGRAAAIDPAAALGHNPNAGALLQLLCALK